MGKFCWLKGLSPPVAPLSDLGQIVSYLGHVRGKGSQSSVFFSAGDKFGRRLPVKLPENGREMRGRREPNQPGCRPRAMACSKQIGGFLQTIVPDQRHWRLLNQALHVAVKCFTVNAQLVGQPVDIDCVVCQMLIQ